MAGRSYRWRPRQALVWWTSGKDSAWALHLLQQDPAWDVRGLIAPVSDTNGRALLHGTRGELLERQAAAIGLPLQCVPLDWAASERVREAPLQQALGSARSEGVEFVVCGDLRADVRRERRTEVVGGAGLEAVFPLWGRDSATHARDLLAADVTSWVCSVETTLLPAGLSGRPYDGDFVNALPEGVDATGENEEFHTFVEWAPGWQRRVPVGVGRTIEVYDYAFTEIESGEFDEEVDGDEVLAEPGDGPPRSSDPFICFERLARVRRFVDDHIAEHLGVDSVAEAAAMTPTGFSRYFRQHVGTTFVLWLGQRRVEHACGLLQQQDLAVGRVSETVGFHSERTFRRAFHDHMGCSPSEYRKRLLEEEAPA